MSETDRIAAQFGQNVRKYRTLRGLTQVQLSETSGLQQAFISIIERGETNVSLATIVALADALEIPSVLLLEGVDRPKK